MKRQIAMALIVSVALSGTAWAQSGEEVLASLRAKVDAQMRERCQNKETRISEEWCVEQGYLPPPTTKWLSPGLALAGVLSIAAGMGVAMHWGEDTKNVLGSQYCVSDYGDVEYGSCGSAMQTRIGLAMIGGGALMTFIGTRHVAINPQILKDKKAVTATVAWGSDRRQ